MIAFIHGKLIECQLTLAILEVNGIGYEVHVPLTTVERLPSLGETVKLFTHATYREDAQTLYGFIDRESRDFFRMIVDKLSGIGPKIAFRLARKNGTLKLSLEGPRPSFPGTWSQIWDLFCLFRSLLGSPLSQKGVRSGI